MEDCEENNEDGAEELGKTRNGQPHGTDMLGSEGNLLPKCDHGFQDIRSEAPRALLPEFCENDRKHAKPAS